MDGFSRAYRDPKSPLTPITPLSVNNVFSFCLGGDDSLKAWIDQIDAGRQKRSPNTCGLQSRSSPRFGTASGSNASGFSGASSSTKSPKNISNAAANLVANCILSRFSSNSPRPSATAKSSLAASTSSSKSPSFSSASGSTSASSRYSTANGSTSTRIDSTSSRYETARGPTSASSCYESSCVSTSPRCGTASTARCFSQSSSSSSLLTDSTTSDSSCDSHAPTPKIVVNGQQSQAENAGAAALLEWVVDRLSPSPRKSLPNVTQCLYALLSRFGLEKYFSIFQREEIDIEVFRSLTLTDLILLGITNSNDCAKLMEAVAAAFLMR